MNLAITIIFFLLGTIIGSFLNVVIFRYNTKKSLGGRSACMTCQNKLSWYELIPVFSYLGLLGRCSSCKSRISPQYPAIEFLTGLIFALLFLKFEWIFYFHPPHPFIFFITYAYYAVEFCLLIVIATYDMKHKIIPDMLVFIFGLMTFVGLFLFVSHGLGGLFFFHPHMPLWVDFLSGPLIALPFALLWLISAGRAMGLGDAKLALGLGWLLGITKMLSAILVAVWSGAIIGLLLIIFSKKYGVKSEIPFAPFLLLGVLLAFLFELHLFPILGFH